MGPHLIIKFTTIDDVLVSIYQTGQWTNTIETEKIVYFILHKYSSDYIVHSFLFGIKQNGFYSHLILIYVKSHNKTFLKLSLN